MYDIRPDYFKLKKTSDVEDTVSTDNIKNNSEILKNNSEIIKNNGKILKNNNKILKNNSNTLKIKSKMLKYCLIKDAVSAVYDLLACLFKKGNSSDRDF